MAPIISQTEIQEYNPYGSREHRQAHEDLVKIAKQYNAAQYFEGY